jgi:cytoskeletal protein CcmA (bactofilin family)
MARSAHVGLLTSIFGNRDEGASDAGKSSESVEKNQMREPDDRTPSHGPEVPADTRGSELADSSAPEAPLLGEPETGVHRQADSALRHRRTGKVSVDTAVRRSTRPSAPTTSSTPAKSAPDATSDAMSRDAASKQTPARHAPAQALDNRRSGAVWKQGAAIARDTALSMRVHAAQDDGAHSRTTRSDGEDPDEIDVSDQLEALEDAEASDDLAYEDLIIEDEEDDEDEDTSISVSAWGGQSGVASAVRAAPPASPAGDIHDPSGAARQDSDPAQAARLDPERTGVAATQAIKQTLVETDTVFEGTIQSSYPVVVHGTINGEVDAPALSIGDSGVINGIIRSKTLRSQGTLSGSVDAGEVVLSGTVHDRTVVRARRLEVKLESSEEGWVNVTFRTGTFEPSDVGSEPGPDRALGASATARDEDGTSAG